MEDRRSERLPEQTIAVLWANTWAFNFILVALLIDIMYRSVIFHEAAWDLFALIGVSGAIAGVYAARQNVLMFNRRFVAVLLVSALIAAVVGAVLAMTKVM